PRPGAVALAQDQALLGALLVLVAADGGAVAGGPARKAREAEERRRPVREIAADRRRRRQRCRDSRRPLSPALVRHPGVVAGRGVRIYIRADRGAVPGGRAGDEGNAAAGVADVG